jgi:hypothetical protein
MELMENVELDCIATLFIMGIEDCLVDKFGGLFLGNELDQTFQC